ncbi:hypothetical protein AUF62_00875 [archaeon 13_1_20CM_52_20]|nr:MAG: hypothetical protein AUF62_00875 [archaeon 13_1_20CM_52_20]
MAGFVIFTIVWKLYWVYGAALVYLVTVTILMREVGISLPLSTLTTDSNLLLATQLGLLWMIIMNLYGMRLSKRREPWLAFRIDRENRYPWLFRMGSNPV